MSADTYSIRQVMDLTGLSEFTLRGWENRYQAFRPRRTPTGRRQYSGRDLEKAILLRELLLRDFKIGALADLSLAELGALLEKKPYEAARPTGPFDRQIQQVLRDVSLQKWQELESDLHKIARSGKPLEVLTGFFAPLLTAIGREVAAGTVSIAQEHVFSSFVKERLYVLGDQAKKPGRQARFVVATPEGDHHELGVLVAQKMLVLNGFRSLYLGPNTPKADLCEAALRFGATYVLLGSTVSRKEGAREDLYAYLHFLDRNLPGGCPIWLGGRNAELPERDGAREIVSFSSLPDLEKALHHVG